MKTFLCIFIFLLLFPIRTLPAEVLQVTSASVLQVGDHNRNYKIRIACIKIDQENEKDSIEWLRSEIPRHTKINFFPKGSEDGILLARVTSLKTGNDLASKLVELGYAKSIC